MEEFDEYEVKYLHASPSKSKAIYQDGWYLVNGDGDVVDGPFSSRDDAQAELDRLQEPWI